MLHTKYVVLSTKYRLAEIVHPARRFASGLSQGRLRGGRPTAEKDRRLGVNAVPRIYWQRPNSSCIFPGDLQG